MQPLLRDGQLVVLLRSRRASSVGNIVFINDDGVEKIKAITRIEGRRVWHSGANHQSTDSRDSGWVARSSVGAILVWPRISAEQALAQATRLESL